MLFSPDGQTLASVYSSGSIPLWDTKTGKLKKKLTGHTKDVYSLSFSPDGKTLASSGRDHTICLWDVETGTLQKTFIGHTETVYSVSFSPDGRTLATGGGDKTIRLWDDANTGKLRKILKQADSDQSRIVQFRMGKRLRVPSSNHTIHLWDAQTGQTPKNAHRTRHLDSWYVV